MNTHERSLKQYVEKDKIYQKYKLGVFPESDFDRFCFVHCEDIEWALSEIKHLRELQKSMDKQYEELESNWNDLKKFVEIEKDRLVRQCSQIYEDSLGKTRLVSEDIYNELKKISDKMQEIESSKNE